MNFSTFIILLVLIGLVTLSIRYYRKKGTCGYKDKCGHQDCNAEYTGECSAAEKMKRTNNGGSLKKISGFIRL